MTGYTVQDALNEMLELADVLEARAENWARAEYTDDVTRARSATFAVAAHKIRMQVSNIQRAEGLAE